MLIGPVYPNQIDELCGLVGRVNTTICQKKFLLIHNKRELEPWLLFVPGLNASWLICRDYNAEFTPISHFTYHINVAIVFGHKLFT